MKSWKDVKLRQLQEISLLGEFEDKTDEMISALSILLDKDPADIENMPVSDIHLEFNEWSFLNIKPEPKLIPIVKVNNREYGICDLSKITMAQLVDIEEYFSEGLIENLHKILSVIYLPIKRKKWLGKGYDVEKYKPSDERKEDFLDATMDVLYPTALFFFSGVMNYIKSSASSLMEEKKVMMEMMIYQEEGLSPEVKKEWLRKLKESGIGSK